MITFLAWLIEHSALIGFAGFAAAVGGLLTPRFNYSESYTSEVESWLAALLGIVLTLIAYAVGALNSWQGAIAVSMVLSVLLVVYWFGMMPMLTPALHRPSYLLDKTLRRYTVPIVGGQVISHSIMLLWSLVVIVPIWTMIVNSLKEKREIFRTPFDWPTSESFTLDGYKNAWIDGNFDLYFTNSIIVTVTALIIIMVVGAMAGYALANWRSRLSTIVYLYFIAGLMVPIRLGTINIVTIVQDLGLGGKLTGLIPIYVAMGLPITAFVLTTFMREIPSDLIDAARMDGASEIRVFGQIVLPLVRPALATVAVFNMIPIYNDLWFPLILTRAEENRTVTYGVSLLFGQYQTDWNAILSTLSLAAVPILILYLLMSKQFIRGLTAGAIKG